MKVVFLMRHAGFGRNFESALLLLARHGHDVRILLERSAAIGGEEHLQKLADDEPGISIDWVDSASNTFWDPLAVGLRSTLDYLRYLEPIYDDSPSLRERARRQVPSALARACAPLAGRRTGRTLLGASLRAAERTIPPSGIADQILDQYRPDVLLVSPLLYFGSSQVDYVRAARARGIPTVLCATSWDHLTTKGLIHEAPESTLVWNEFQKDEAVQLHGLDPSAVAVTGAQAYDHWFTYRPLLARVAFCAEVGLDPDRAYVLYVCSSPFIAPGEVGFVRRWIEALRARGTRDVRNLGVLVRPHPQNAEQWRGADLTDLENVVVWPRAGANPVDTESRNDYFHSMYHAAAIMGINTSAFIESAIVGRPVYTVLDPEFAETQEGTLHFKHLLHANGGLLHVATDFDEHAAQLAEALTNPEAERVKSERFVEAFVRPLGRDVLAAPVFVECVERQARRGVRRSRLTPGYAGAVRAALTPIAAVAWAARWLDARPKRLPQSAGLGWQAADGPGARSTVRTSPGARTGAAVHRAAGGGPGRPRPRSHAERSRRVPPTRSPTSNAGSRRSRQRRAGLIWPLARRPRHRAAVLDPVRALGNSAGWAGQKAPRCRLARRRRGLVRRPLLRVHRARESHRRGRSPRARYRAAHLRGNPRAPGRRRARRGATVASRQAPGAEPSSLDGPATA